MREILFKAKRTDNGEWVEGLVAHPHVTTEKGVESYYFYEIDKEGKSYQRTVLANTLCQYTGLTDKNGNKIWENDILTYDAYNDGVVRYGEAVQGACSHVGFYVDWLNKDACLRSDLGFWMSKRDIKVTGNIFDYPET